MVDGSEYLAESFMLNYKKGNFERALEIAEELLRSNKRDLMGILGKSLCLYETGRYNESLNFIKSNIKYVGEKDARELAQLIESLDFLNINPSNPEIEVLLKQVERSANREVALRAKFSLIIYYIISNDIGSASALYNSLELKNKKSFLKRLFDEVLSAGMNNETAKVLREYIKPKTI